jgi:hypothetical protein
VLLRDRLSITALGQLLQLEAEHVIQTLLGTQSILMIPEGDNQPIRFFHTSLADFLKVESRSHQFFIDPPIRHICITTDCLAAMELQPQEGIVYSGGQQYACLNWCYHLHQGLVEGGDNCLHLLSSASLINWLMNFVSQSHYFWVNTLIHKGWKTTMRDLNEVISMLKVCTMF